MSPALWPKLREAKCLAQGHPGGEAELGSAFSRGSFSWGSPWEAKPTLPRVSLRLTGPRGNQKG